MSHLTHLASMALDTRSRAAATSACEGNIRLHMSAQDEHLHCSCRGSQPSCHHQYLDGV